MNEDKIAVFKKPLLDELKFELKLNRGWGRRKWVDGFTRAIVIVERQEPILIPEPKYIPAPPPKPKKPPECQHKYRDYDWYMNYGATDGNVFKYEIYEPYVCVKCGTRIDILLENGTHQFSGREEYLKLIEDLKRKYPKLRNRADVENEVNDDLLVDREYLRILDMIRGDAEVNRVIKLRLEAATDGEETRDEI